METAQYHPRDELRLDILDLFLELVQGEDDRERAPVGFCDLVVGGLLARLEQLDHLCAGQRCVSDGSAGPNRRVQKPGFASMDHISVEVASSLRPARTGAQAGAENESTDPLGEDPTHVRISH